MFNFEKGIFAGKNFRFSRKRLKNEHFRYHFRETTYLEKQYFRENLRFLRKFYHIKIFFKIPFSSNYTIHHFFKMLNLVSNASSLNITRNHILGLKAHIPRS
jgi:hypothetical protein